MSRRPSPPVLRIAMLAAALLTATAAAADPPPPATAEVTSPSSGPGPEADVTRTLVERAPSRVLVLDPELPNDTSLAMVRTLVTEVGNLEEFEAISAEELRAALGAEAEKAALGCNDASCLSELAGAVDARFVMFGTIERETGSRLRVRLTTFDTTDVRVASRAVASARRPSDVPAAVVRGLPDLLLPLIVDDAARETLRVKLGKVALERGGEAAREGATEAAKEVARTEAREVSREEAKKTAEQLIAKAIQERAEVRFGPQTGPRVYLADPTFAGVDEAMAPGLLAAMAQAAQDEGVSVMTAEDVREILQQQEAKAAFEGETDEQIFLALGNAMGIRHIVGVTFTIDGADTLVQARLMNAELGEVVNRREVRASSWDGSVPTAAKVASKVVLAPIFAQLQGKLVVEVSEEGASVLIDDEIIGTTPFEGTITLPGGTHVLAVTKDGFIKHEELVKVTRGTELSTSVLLRPSEDFVAAHKATAYSVIGLASALSLAPPALLLAGAGSVGLGFYFWFIGTANVNEAYRNADLRELDDSGQPNPVLAEYQRAYQQQQINAYLSWAIAAAPITLAVASAALALGAWAFVQDPWKYDGLVDTAAE